MEKSGKKEGEGKKGKKVRLTERDLKILGWISIHRMATVEQVSKKFDMSILSATKRLFELRSADYLIYEKIFQNKAGVYLLAKNGVAVANDGLPICKIRLGSYEHDLALVDLALYLEQKENALWVTDRQIKQKLGIEGVGVKGHSPDGILELMTGEKIAVELELTLKGTKRLESILKDYAKSQYKEVWYFVKSQAIGTKVLSKATSKVRAFLLSDMKEIKLSSPSLETIRGIKVTSIHIFTIHSSVFIWSKLLIN